MSPLTCCSVAAEEELRGTLVRDVHSTWTANGWVLVLARTTGRYRHEHRQVWFCPWCGAKLPAEVR